MYGGAKSRVVTISFSPQSRDYTRALKSEKSLSLPIPVGVGAVDTNDWCISEAPTCQPPGDHIPDSQGLLPYPHGYSRDPRESQWKL